MKMIYVIIEKVFKSMKRVFIEMGFHGNHIFIKWISFFIILVSLMVFFTLCLDF
jgi:hypothetical protein